MLTLLALMVGTLASEDAACVAAGALIAAGRVSSPAAIAACAVGIVGGDFGLWFLGRAGMRFAARFRARFPASRTKPLALWLREHSAVAIVASRFLPGTRLPLYVTAGAIGVPAMAFAMWSCLAALVWTPALVLFAAGLGSNAAPGGSLMGRFGLAAAAIPAVALGRTLLVPSLRRRAAARLARWTRWEFWPMWLFYGPVALWIAGLAIRYRGLGTITAANPAIPDGGTVGESKYDILSRLPFASIVPSLRISAGPVDQRIFALRHQISARGWTLPLVLKPDVGQRGVGVKLVRSWEAAGDYLASVAGPVLAQPYDPGPFEAGVFYYRFPGSARGRLLSVTDKVFPEIVGDGTSTIEALIWQHPRFRMQASLFLERHRDALNRVLAPGERFRLALAGNHAQGTIFRDGAHLITPALETRIDEIARYRPGFFIGRFDIRYRDVEAFMAGRDFAIVELNGATAESTNIYDLHASLWSAYRMLFRQWALVFAIGAANRRAGASVTSLRRLAGLVHAHLTSPIAFQMSD